MRWTPKAERWPQDGGAPGEPDLLVHVPGWQPMYVDVAIVHPYGARAGQAARDEELDKESN